MDAQTITTQSTDALIAALHATNEQADDLENTWRQLERAAEAARDAYYAVDTARVDILHVLAARFGVSNPADWNATVLAVEDELARRAELTTGVAS